MGRRGQFVAWRGRLPGMDAVMAETAGCEPWQILALNCLPSDFWGKEYRPAPLTDLPQGRDVLSAYDAQGYEPMMGGDCTTFIALGEATVSGETMFHKNRDERDEVQCLYIKHLDGCHRFIGGGDIGITKILDTGLIKLVGTFAALAEDFAEIGITLRRAGRRFDMAQADRDGEFRAQAQALTRFALRHEDTAAQILASHIQKRFGGLDDGRVHTARAARGEFFQ